jgi:hypothetical protein
MPFGLTGAPTTFVHVTAEKLGDLLPKLNAELLVDDGGMAGDNFKEMLDRTRHFTNDDMIHIEHFFDSFKHCSVHMLPNAWNFNVNSFDPYNRHSMGCV